MTTSASSPGSGTGGLGTSACRWCGMLHTGAGVCPTVKAIEFFEDGTTIKRVEFKTPADYVIPSPGGPVWPPHPNPWPQVPPVTWGAANTATAEWSGRGYYEEDVPGYDEAS